MENYFAADPYITDERKIKFAVCYLSADGLQWWELTALQNNIPSTFSIFKEELLKHFEPINRELNARRILNSLKQMGRLNTIRSYNQEFMKWLLQIPTMQNAEQIFHFSQELKNRIRMEIERAEPSNIHEAMRIADRLDSLYNANGFNSFGNGGSQGPVPMQIGNLNSRNYQRLSYGERQRRIANKLCFVCGKPNCIARNHRRSNNNNGNQTWNQNRNHNNRLGGYPNKQNNQTGNSKN